MFFNIDKDREENSLA